MVVMFPLQLEAQISTAKAEKYKLFTVVKTIKCVNMPPGATGSARIWDFSGLTPKTLSDTTKAKYLEHDASMPFASSNIVRKVGNIYTFYEYKTNGVYELGSLDSNSNPPDTLRHPDSKRIMMHPMTYVDQYTDTFTVDAGSKATGGGNITNIVESFGMLILPNDTFENVIRMRITEDFTGTVVSVPTDIHKVSYQWYDIDHSTPLLRIDSTTTTSSIGTTNIYETAYLLDEDPVAIADIEITRLPISAVFSGDDLVLTGGTEAGHTYNLALYTITGQKLYNATFTGGKQHHFSTNCSITAGMYMLTVDDIDNYGTIGVLKIVK